MTQQKYSEKELELNMTQMRRNPYLADYASHRSGLVRNSSVKNAYNRNVSDKTASASLKKAAQTYPIHRIAKATSAYNKDNTRTNDYNTRIRKRRVREARQRRRRMARIRRAVKIFLLCVVILTGIVGIRYLLKTTFDITEADTSGNTAYAAAPDTGSMGKDSGAKIQGLSAEVYAAHPNWEENFLTVNEYSRPGDPLTEVNNIFVHYTANPGTSAAQNRSYFEQLKDNHERSASAHFIIGYDGEIMQCVPLDEIAYAVQTRNEDSISIECCYKADNGQFTQETYDSLIRLLKWLTDAYDLQPDDILRHYDCGGKKCPLYYVEHEDAWIKLKEDVKNL